MKFYEIPLIIMKVDEPRSLIKFNEINQLK